MATREQIQNRIDQLSLSMAYIPYNSPRLMAVIEERDQLELQLQKMSGNAVNTPNRSSGPIYQSPSLANPPTNNSMSPYSSQQSTPSTKVPSYRNSQPVTLPSYISGNFPSIPSQLPSYASTSRIPTIQQPHSNPSPQSQQVPHMNKSPSATFTLSSLPAVPVLPHNTNTQSTPPKRPQSCYNTVSNIQSIQPQQTNTVSNIPTRPPPPSSSLFLDALTQPNSPTPSRPTSGPSNLFPQNPSSPNLPPNRPHSPQISVGQSYLTPPQSPQQPSRPSNLPSYMSSTNDLFMPMRPAPPPPDAFARGEFLEKEARLTQKESELQKKEEELLELERKLELREKELNEREQKLKQQEETLKVQKRNQIQVLAKTQSNAHLPKTSSYNQESIISCQRIIRRFLHKKRLMDKKIQPKSLQELLQVVEKDDSKEKRKNHHYWVAMKEILQTEESYVNDLGIIVNNYMRPIFSSDNIIRTADAQEIFGNLNQIYGINSAFLEELKKGFYLPNIGGTQLQYAFGNFIPKLPLYCQYYVDFDRSNELRQKLKNNAKFRGLLEKIQKESPNPMLDLDTYMIKPCQRLPRYKILMEALIKNTSSENVHLETYKHIAKKIDEVICNINEQKRDAENMQKVSKIAEKLTCPPNFSLSIPTRRYVYHSPLCILPEKTLKHSWKTGRFGYLFNDVIIATKTKVLSSNQTVICLIDLREPISLEAKKDSSGKFNRIILNYNSN